MTRRRTRAALVTAQVAVAMVLVAGAALFARSLSAALSLNAGVGMDRVVSGGVHLGAYGYNVPRATAFFDDLYAALRANPAVDSLHRVARRHGRSICPSDVPRQFPRWCRSRRGDTYLRTWAAGIAGRTSSDCDYGRLLSSRCQRSFARNLADGGNSIGKRVKMPHSRAGRPADVMEVVGVVGDVVTRVSVLEPLDMYFPLRQTAATLGRDLVVRAAGTSDAARREIMGAVKAIDPAVAPSPLITLEERIGQQMAPQRLGAMVLAALGIIAVLLTILGTYVVSESMAAMRMREMGIRAALGATRAQLGAIVMAETGRLVGLGLV